MMKCVKGRSRFSFLLTTWVVFLATTTLHAQDNISIFSPKQYITVHYTPSDSIMILQLFKEAKKVRYINKDSCILLLQQMKSLSHAKNFHYGIAKSQIALSGLYIEAGDYKKGEQLFREAFVYCNSTRGRGNGLFALWCNNISLLYLYQGKYEQGYDILSAALNEMQKQKIPDSTSLALLYSTIGTLWQRVGEPEKALYYLQNAKQAAIAIKDSAGLCSIYNNLGTTYTQKKDFANATACYQKVIRIAEEIRRTSSLQIAYINLGDMYRQKGEMEKAIVYLKKGLALSDQYNPYNSIIAPCVYLSRIYFEKKDYPLARYYANEALNAGWKLKATHSLLEVHQLLAKINKASGNYREAYQNMEDALALKDSVMSTAKYRAINELEIKYKASEKDRKLTAQQLQLKTKNIWIGGMISGVFILLVFGFIFYRHKQKLQSIRLSNIEKDKEINYYKAIMQGEEKERARIAHELHDGIVSQLTSVKLRFSKLLEPGQPIDRQLFEQGYNYLNETVQDLRKTAHNLMPETVIKSNLPNAVKDFCQKMANEDTLQIHFITNGDYYPLEKTFELSLYRMIQELVQNALKYSRADNLIVQLSYHEYLLEVTVEDDGVGFDPGDINNAGMGLKTIRERINIVNGHMEILSGLHQGTTIYFQVPFNSYSKTYQNVYQNSDNRGSSDDGDRITNGFVGPKQH